MELVLLIHLIYWRKARNYQRDPHGKGFIEIQLIYLVDIFQDN